MLTLIKLSHLRGKGDNSQSCYERMEVKKIKNKYKSELCLQQRCYKAIPPYFDAFWKDPHILTLKDPSLHYHAVWKFICVVTYAVIIGPFPLSHLSLRGWGYLAIKEEQPHYKCSFPMGKNCYIAIVRRENCDTDLFGGGGVGYG